MTNLARETIGRLIEEASWTERAKSLERLAARYAEGGLDAAEWREANDVFRIVLYDAEPLVRRVLAETVKFVPDLPRDILLALARDQATVATPILEQSRLLADDDLLAIVERHSAGHRLAIAGRRALSPRVAAALCRQGDRAAILRLLDNDGAAIGEGAIHGLLDRFTEDRAVTDAIARRRLLPRSVALRLSGPSQPPANSPGPGWSRTGSLG
jgi:uncharacterized protein (DUF2336 family)